MTTSSRLSEGELREARARALQHSAIRQTATYRAACAAATYAPTHDDCAAALDRARDELEHLERTEDLYRELTGAELTEAIAAQAERLPLPTSWFEAALAQLVLCLAARIEATHCAGGRRAASAVRLMQECEHVDAARAAMRELRVSHTRHVPVDRAACWLQVALQSLGEPERAAYLTALQVDVAALGVPAAISIVAA